MYAMSATSSSKPIGHCCSRWRAGRCASNRIRVPTLSWGAWTPCRPRTFWRAGQRRKLDKRGATLTWTISTDDPITFSTTLADEYAYAWAGMTMRAKNPVDPAYARALLDEAAATSMRTRFTVRRDETRNREKQRGRPNP